MDDFDLNRESASSGSGLHDRRGPSLVPLVAIGAFVLALIAGGWWYFGRPEPAPVNQTAAVLQTEAPLSPTPAPTAALPPLDQLDPLLRKLIAALSSRPELARWLASDGLIYQLAQAVDVVSQGRTPAKDFKMLTPAGAFRVSARGRRRAIDPASYRRYDGLVVTLTSIDAEAAARLYATVRPRLNEAYQKRGHPNADVDEAMAKALGLLIDTPVLDEPVIVVEGTGPLWAYDDPAVESLAPAQKQLLRTGPANVEKVITWLRAFQGAMPKS